ncbi:Reverse transcriptase (RNA-dependent DNA polymerase) [Nitrosospira sp. Nsp14]|uniref:reverse transcriptase domain-containing protein n=1 Tax=Nitrosospira sp. Nsp14 TaxID=1855333 RepID=UPI0008F15394|nr:reverse transcriptase domain-containing protein [Nitrosospira sp. Nsp14]SFH22334.1 Reverse transcriptase (RNA-dependent DNA polymerase) [Nitrosospira sp. Nsp14]
MSFTLKDLGLAYRKAKVDLYYSSHASLLAIAEYESELTNNLQALLDKLNGADEEWIEDPLFLGDWTLAPKAISLSEKNKAPDGLIFSSPAEEWEHRCEGGKHTAEFRLMAQCSLAFHVLSTLWIIKVGHQYDKKLHDCAYGSRLRRGKKGEINLLSLGSFKPYLKPFREWRDGGIDAMRTALAAKKKVISLTADVSSFYHELNPSFMLNEKFKQLLELELKPEEEKLNRLFIAALKEWAKRTPLEKGLPVGLPASAVVANVALFELDQLIEQQVAPLYYGRYMDDILLVMENGAKSRSPAALWQWLLDRSGGKLDWIPESKQEEIQFKPDYLSNSKIYFANKKNKVFLLEGETGQTLVDAIAHQIQERASEWRALPNLPMSASHVATDLIAATQHDGEVADNLRKTSALTMRRAGFSIKLRDFEAYERDLLPETWKNHRQAFFRAFCQHVLVLPHFFELAIYLPRVVKLAIACEDFDSLCEIIEQLKAIYKRLEQNCNLTIKALPESTVPNQVEILNRWQDQLLNTIQENIIAAFPPRLSKAGRVAWQTHKSVLETKGLSEKEIQAKQAELFSFDLGHQPFRFIGLPKEMVAQRGIPTKKKITILSDAASLLSPEIIDGITTLTGWIKVVRGLPQGLLFATRPFNLAELFVLAKDPFDSKSHSGLRAVVLALRGFTLDEKTPYLDKQGVLQIPDGKEQRKFAIAVSSWKTEYNSWVASVVRTTDPDAHRYARLNRLVNSVISQPKRARYFILPELALPARWFMRIALKLQGRGISLITGIEYLHGSKSRVRNQVWAALSHDGLGFPSMMIYRQDKQRPALPEEQELRRLAGLEMKPAALWKENKPLIIRHGDFHFALLVCSELTNISYRASLRGQVDALFVPEWNQDTETFNALVESAALDIHAYIIQCNDRQYGDSRIRAPAKDSWQRDVLRVKGGVTDYCVIGDIDVLALRQFQSCHRSPSGPFKPVPDGFDLHSEHSRRVLPARG